MAKEFKNLDRNKNTGNVLDRLTTQVGVPYVEKEKKHKFYSYKMPEEWHDVLKFDLSKKYDMNIHELITQALKNSYPELP